MIETGQKALSDGSTSHQDMSKLKWLSVFWYLFAAIHAIPILVLVVVVGLKLVWFLGGGFRFNASATTPFVVFVTGVLLGSLHVALSFLVARCLSRQNRYGFCQVVAALNCLVVPVGTILAIFTLVVLSRGGVRALFGVADGSPAAAGDPPSTG
ncbi:hypothetical protein [Lignipirellula cremea]|uniref:Uncharacterized protein n=1 Tax=Lignipirellula cremea TaxID=2528010 RepID=A0A518DZR4_9BACT|nr:hypothetical protein [Lignipirellula cremea]QDU97301.1 hypothetical protein Pla8534_51470 [Lignipirellula cremea]